LNRVLLSPAGTVTAPAGAAEGPSSRPVFPHTVTGGDVGSDVGGSAGGGADEDADGVGVGVGVALAVGVALGVGVTLTDGLGVGVTLCVGVGVGVALCVGLTVGTGGSIAVRVLLGVGCGAGRHLCLSHARSLFDRNGFWTKVSPCDTVENTSLGPAVSVTAIIVSVATGSTNTSRRQVLTRRLDPCLEPVISR
jgi:hypothetical protein